MRQRREFNARRGNPKRHIPERWIPETAGNLITRHVKLIEQLEGRFNGETKQTHRYRLYPTWNSSIRENQLYSIYHLQKSFNEFTVILDVPIKLNSNKAKWKVKEKKKKKRILKIWIMESIETNVFRQDRRSLAYFRDYFYSLGKSYVSYQTNI